ncbi:MAG: DUF4062 domain-containing protein [Deltaproteobacteria bacterium]|nr:DUF4062 domain-containing protein [Deltaproteobacteria bacterium]
MNEVCISSRRKGAEELRKSARKACTQNQCSAVELGLNYEKEESVRDAIKTMKESDLFVGIYGGTYGKRTIMPPDSDDEKNVSPIELELRLAMKHFEKENIKLYVLNANSEDPDFKVLYNNYISKCDKKNCDDLEDFVLKINADIKSWYSNHTRKQIESDAKKTLMSIEVKCKDTQGILTSIFRVLSKARGNVSHASQTVYRGMADITVLAKLEQPNVPENKTQEDETIESKIRKELHKCDEDLSSSAIIIDIRDIEGHARKVKDRGHYTVEFFDNPGIAELLFNVFSDAEICILGSNLDHFPSSPQVGRFFIIADLTNIDRKVTRDLVPTIEKITNVIHVEGKIEMGSWWY